MSACGCSENRDQMVTTNPGKAGVLLVDDRPENLLALEALLEGLDYRLLKAQSGIEALKLLLEEDVALILLDVQMPEMDGFETARLIRQRERTRHVPIIFVTAIYEEEHHVAQGYAAGAMDYMVKPIQLDVLKAKVAAFLDLAKEHQVLQVAFHEQAKAVQSLTRQQDELELQVQTRTLAWEQANATLRQENAERQRVEAELRRSHAAKDAYLALLGHELRNPLAALSNASYVLQQFPAESPIIERHRAIIHRQTHHLTRLVDDLLDAARLTHGKLTLKPERTDLAQLVQHVVEDLYSGLEAHRQQLSLEFPLERVWVDADPVRIAQVLLNLLRNALKYTPEGGHIYLSLGQDGTQAVIRVQDDGEGIAPEALPHLFEPFFQAGQSLDRSEGGLGMGLTVAQTLADMHGGSLEGWSDGPGCGSAFVLRLPLADKPPTS